MGRMRGGGPRQHPFTFDHTGEDGKSHKVSGFIVNLSDNDTFTLNRLTSDAARQAGNFDPDLAQFAALRSGVKLLKVDQRTYKIGDDKKPVPRILDPEYGQTIYERTLGFVIKFNPFLVEEERYRDVFEEFVLDDPDVEVPEEDPTELQ
jgi:hypothetical protein